MNSTARVGERLKMHLSMQPKASLEDAMKKYKESNAAVPKISDGLNKTEGP
jgi:hypothetical protein